MKDVFEGNQQKEVKEGLEALSKSIKGWRKVEWLPGMWVTESIFSDEMEAEWEKEEAERMKQLENDPEWQKELEEDREFVQKFYGKNFFSK